MLVSHIAFQVTKTLQQFQMFYKLVLLLSLITVYKKRNQSFKWLNLLKCVGGIYCRILIVASSSLCSVFL